MELDQFCDASVFLGDDLSLGGEVMIYPEQEGQVHHLVRKGAGGYIPDYQPDSDLEDEGEVAAVESEDLGYEGDSEEADLSSLPDAGASLMEQMHQRVDAGLASEPLRLPVLRPEDVEVNRPLVEEEEKEEPLNVAVLVITAEDWLSAQDHWLNEDDNLPLEE